MNPYQALANAIVLSAVSEYRAALKRLRRDTNNASAQSEVDKAESFFFSDWYRVLTDVDGEYLVRRLRSEAGL